MGNFIIWRNGEKSTWGERKLAEHLWCSYLDSLRRLIQNSLLAKGSCAHILHFWIFFPWGQVLYQTYSWSICWVPPAFWESVATNIAQKALKAAKAEPAQRDILQLYSSLEAAASENVLLKMASKTILLIKGSCTKGNRRFYKSWTKM